MISNRSHSARYNRHIVLPGYRRDHRERSTIHSIVMAIIRIVIAGVYGILTVLTYPSGTAFLLIPIILLLLLVLWMLPDRSVYPAKAMTTVIQLYLVFTVVWPSYIAVDALGLPWVTPTRFLLMISVFLLLYSLFTSAPLRAYVRDAMANSKAITLLFCIYTGYQFFTIPFSSEPGSSLIKVLNNNIYWTAPLLTAVIIFREDKAATRVIRIMLFGAALLCLDGIAEGQMEMIPWANLIPSFLHIDASLLAQVTGRQARAADGLYRVRGPFTNSLMLAELLAICMPFVIHYLVQSRRIIVTAGLALLWFMIMYTILLTHSRLGLVGVLIAHIFYFFLWAVRRRRRADDSLLATSLLYGFPVIAAAVVLMVFTVPALSLRLLGGGAQMASTEARVVQRNMAIPKVLSNPFGYGAGQSGDRLGFISPGGVVTVDNYYITTVMDFGIIGLISFPLIFLATAWYASIIYLKATDDETSIAGPISAVMMIFVVEKSVLSQDYNHQIVFMLVGMVIAFRRRIGGQLGYQDGQEQLQLKSNV